MTRSAQAADPGQVRPGLELLLLLAVVSRVILGLIFNGFRNVNN